VIISRVHVKILPKHLQFMRVNVEPVYIGPLMYCSIFGGLTDNINKI
jgi:hypothetical protein